MQKSMILLLFLQLIIIKADNSINIIFQGKCEDDKAKTGACMYELDDYDSKGHTKYALFDKCGKGEICNGYEMCLEKFEKRKIGKSCNYDEDCTTNYCVSNKCTAAKEGDKCDGISCESGLTCYYSYDSSNNYNTKCVKRSKEGEKLDKNECMNYLKVDKDGKCAKYGTVDDKNEIPSISSSLLCKSGLAHEKTDEKTWVTTTICDSIEEEPVCDEHGLKKEGKWSDGSSIKDGCDVEEDYTGKEIAYNTKYSKLKSKLYADFLEDYKDLDLDKINNDGMKWKTKEKWILYEYATHLQAAGIIDSDGKVVKDKKCEYEFIMKNYLHSSFIKFNTIILAMIALLF